MAVEWWSIGGVGHAWSGGSADGTFTAPAGWEVDKVSTADGNHDLTAEVRAWAEVRPEAGRLSRRGVVLVIEAPTWRREVAFPELAATASTRNRGGPFHNVPPCGSHN